MMQQRNADSVEKIARSARAPDLNPMYALIPIGGINAKVLRLRVRLVCALTCVFGATGCETVPQGNSANQSIYSFHKNADELLYLAFPKETMGSVFLKGYVFGSRPREFTKLVEVHKTYLDAENVADLPPQLVSWKTDIIESPWLAVHATNNEWRRLLSSRALGRLAILASEIGRGSLTFSSVLEKALFQRDLLQIFVCVYRATALATDPLLSGRGDRTLRVLRQLLKKLFLTRGELAQLRALLPPKLDRTRYVPHLTYDLADDYLPDRVVIPVDGWYEFDVQTERLEHFQAYGGRSFMRIFLHQPGLKEMEFASRWRSAVAAEPGVPIRARGLSNWSPAGLQTLLVRTFGVFLDDGVFADTGFPEEVSIRAFKYAKSTLDMSSSDYRGTFQYQYKMSRSDLLKNVGGLGLRRTQDDDPTVFGFFSTAPDPYHTGGNASASITTMRYNCINCHATASYGITTVFALRLPPRNPGRSPYPNPIRIKPTGREYRFLTEEMEFLLDQGEDSENNRNVLHARTGGGIVTVNR